MRKEEREQSNERQRHKGEERKTRRRGMRRRRTRGGGVAAAVASATVSPVSRLLLAWQQERAREQLRGRRRTRLARAVFHFAALAADAR